VARGVLERVFSDILIVDWGEILKFMFSGIDEILHDFAVWFCVLFFFGKEWFVDRAVSCS